MNKFGIAALAAICVAGPAHAATITFEGQANTIYAAPIVRSGFTLGNQIGEEQHFHEIDSTQFGLPSNGTGVLLNDRDTTIQVQDVTFAVFTLGSVDVATSLGSNPGVGLNIFGFLNNVQTGVINIAALGNGYTTVNGASLGNIDRLVFDGTGGAGGFVIDNLTLNAAGPGGVPEPSAWALLILGFGAVGAGMRRRVTRTTMAIA